MPHLTRLSSDCFLDKERTDKTEYAAWIDRQISELREMKEGYEQRALHNEYLAQRLFKDEANLEIHYPLIHTIPQARVHLELADKIRVKADRVQQEIDRLKIERGKLLKSG